VDDAGSFIRFYCANCGYESTVSEQYAGRKIRCPKCYDVIFVPASEKAGTKYSDYDLNLLDIEEQKIIQSQQVNQSDAFEGELYKKSPKKAESPRQRKLPWFIDILLYPFSKPGLKHFVVFIGVRPFFALLVRILPEMLYYLVGVAGLITYALVFLYMYWYVAECVRDSADGWVRAPQGFGGLPAMSDMCGQVVNIMGCFLVFFGPFVFYMLIARKADVVFWLLLMYAVLFFPMGLLSVVMHDSARGINPHLLISSVRRTLSPYLRLILILVIPLILIGLIPIEVSNSPIAGFIFSSVIIYMALIGAHLLGRFYWLHQDKLNWEV
jgi:ribosomal protein S27E